MVTATRRIRDASIALTRDNYVGPALLRTIGGRSATSSSPVPADLGSSGSLLPKREVGMDIDALPMSSGDEEQPAATEPITAARPAEKPRDKKSEKISPRESKHSTRTAGRARPRLKNEEDLPAIPPPVKGEPTPADDRMELWSQQSGSNKRKKLQHSYSRRNIHAEDAGDGFQTVPEVPDSPQKDMLSSRFSIPDVGHHSPRRKTRKSLKDEFTTLPVPVARPAPRQSKGSSFNMPADVATDLTSSSTSAADSLPMLDLPDSPKNSTLKRSNSTSSLSSVDSIASLVLTQKEKNAMLGEVHAGDEEIASTSRCPLCNLPIDPLHLEKFNFGRRLNIRDQQRFCHEHKVRDAENLQKDNRYPAIDWANLTNDRIPQLLPVLHGILKRTFSSYYRDQLDAAMQDAKGSRKGLQRYLKEGVVDIAKHGYYGPKGARLMGHVITTHMATELNQELKGDKVARAAGVGGYVNAVLVPELMVRLVMDDMHLDNELRARDILGESSGIGILLNGDDEVLTREEDDDEG